MNLSNKIVKRLASSILILVSMNLYAANKLIHQPFEQEEAHTSNFIQGTNFSGSQFFWKNTGSVDGSGYLSIPSTQSDQLWTTKQKYSIEDNGVYILRANFKTEGESGYGSMGFTTSYRVSASGSAGSPISTQYSLGMSFHGGGGSFFVNNTHTNLDWNAGHDLTPGSWYLFELKVEDKTNGSYDLTFNIYDVNQATGEKGDKWMTTKTQTVTNTNLKAEDDLYVFFGVDVETSYRMVGIDNFQIELTENITVTGTQVGATNITLITPVIENTPLQVETTENSTADIMDINASNVLSFSISGTDASKFNIDSTTGVISFLSGVDYENPTDSNSDNIYTLDVKATNPVGTTTETINITVTNIEAEVLNITDGSNVNVTVNENQIGLATITTDLTGAITYTLGGDDSASFSVDNSGVVTFNTAPDYEIKSSYTITVTATNGNNTITQSIIVTINDINDAPTASTYTYTPKVTDDITFDWNSTTTINPQDSDGTITTATIKNQASKGVASVSGNIVTFSPYAQQSGSDEFNLTINDNGGGTVDVTITINDIDTSAIAVSLSYVNTLVESDSNDGSISGSVVITLSGETFSSDANNSSNLSASNIPNGLNAYFVRDSDTQITMSLTGSATSNKSSNNISNLIITFDDSAFETLNATDVTNSTKSDISLSFYDGVISVTADKWQMFSIPRGVTVDTSTLSSQLATSVWAYKDSTWSENPTEANAKEGLWIKPNSTTLKVIGSSTTSYDYANKSAQMDGWKCDESLDANKWNFVSVQHDMSWSDFTKNNITPDIGCVYSVIFNYDHSNDSWNSTDTISANSALWLQHICTTTPSCSNNNSSR